MGRERRSFRPRAVQTYRVAEIELDRLLADGVEAEIEGAKGHEAESWHKAIVAEPVDFLAIFR